MQKELTESMIASLRVARPEQRSSVRNAAPKNIGRGGQASEEGKLAIVANYQTHGYTILKFDESAASIPKSLEALAVNLSLGAPFVPSLYAGNKVATLYDELGMNIITAGGNNNDEPLHPAFQSRVAIEFHTDGTLQDMGEIKTVALVCLERGVSGGEILLFDAVGAFFDLAGRDWNIAKALLDDNGLTRCSTVGNSNAVRSGPVFGYQDGELMTRYSTTPRDHWEYERVRNLGEARKLLDESAGPGSPYRVQLRLEPGEALLIANERVAHARTAYRDNARYQRRMLRALFQRRPSAGGY